MKRCFFGLLCLIFLLSVTGSRAQEQYPLTLTDQGGREVTLTACPRRIVSGYYISTSALLALGVRDRIAGIEAKAAERPLYALCAPELTALPSVGSAKQFDLEGCMALEPDLVVLPLKLRDAAETLTRFGIPVLLVSPESLSSLTEMILLLGQAVGEPQSAQALTDSLSDCQAFLTRALEGVPRPTVYLAGNSSFLSTAGGGMYQSDFIQWAGGENVAAALPGSSWNKISYEQLLLWNPDCIVLASDAAYTVDDVLSDPNLKSLKAVRENRVYRIPGSAEAWDSPVPGSLWGAVWLASRLHPEQITEETSRDMIHAFYETFYHFDCPAE